jgi:nucleoid-associated protein YgaU
MGCWESQALKASNAAIKMYAGNFMPDRRMGCALWNFKFQWLQISSWTVVTQQLNNRPICIYKKTGLYYRFQISPFYSVKKGDSLGTIAKEVYGDINLWGSPVFDK